jgi:hypothetical protein
MHPCFMRYIPVRVVQLRSLPGMYRDDHRYNIVLRTTACRFAFAHFVYMQYQILSSPQTSAAYDCGRAVSCGSGRRQLLLPYLSGPSRGKPSGACCERHPTFDKYRRLGPLTLESKPWPAIYSPRNSSSCQEAWDLSSCFICNRLVLDLFFAT